MILAQGQSFSPQIAFSDFSRGTLLALLLLMILNLGAVLASSIVPSVLAVIIFMGYAAQLSRFSPAAFVLLLGYLFFRFTTLLSGIVIESGAEMLELGLQGEASGATVRLVLVYVVFIYVCTAVIEHFRAYMPSACKQDYAANRNPSWWVRPLLLGIFLFTVLILLIGAQTGYPALTGVSRLEYREVAESKVFLLYISNRLMFTAFLGLIFAKYSGLERKAALGLFIFILCVSILFGEKFTSLIMMLIFFLIPQILLGSGIRLFKLGVGLAVASLLTVPFILLVYGWADDPVAATERLVSRLSGQTQLWFVADQDMSQAFSFDLTSLSHNISSFLTLSAAEMSDQYPYFGAKYFMFNYMDTDLLFLFLETKALTLTFAFEPYLLMTNGWLGMFFPLVLCAVYYALNLSYIMYAFVKADCISLFLAIKLFIWANFALQQGELWFMFGLKAMVLVAVIVCYEFFVGGRRLKF